MIKKIVMLTKTKLAVTTIAIILLATLVASFTVEIGVSANADSYGVWTGVKSGYDWFLIKLAPDGTEILRIPREQLGLPSHVGVGVKINQVDGTIWVWGAGTTSSIVHLSADAQEILASWTVSSWIKRLTIDTSDGGVWLSGGYDPYTFKYSIDGVLIRRITSPIYPTWPHWCAGVSVNSVEGTTWMTSSPSTVSKLNSDGSEILSVSGFDNTGSLLSVDQTDGSVWIADTQQNEVVKLDTNGVELVRVNVGSDPCDVVANPADGGVWVAFTHTADEPIKRLDSSGNIIATSEIIYSVLGVVSGIDIAPDGTVWAGEYYANKVHKLSPSGEVLLSVVVGQPNWISIFPESVDLDPPQTTIELNGVPGSDDWFTSNVEIQLLATDDVSGVASTFYSLNSGDYVESTQFTVTTEGFHVLDFYSVDNAGNIEETQTITFKIDKTPPSITGQALPIPNENDWNNQDVTISFATSDVVSGVFSGTTDVIVSSNGESQSVVGTAIDYAGNIASFIVTGINIDKVLPTITGYVTTAPNEFGWYNDNVIVHFEASDGLSGLAYVTPDVEISEEGADQSVIGLAVDYAGNEAAFIVTDINIDKTDPTVEITQPLPYAIYEIDLLTLDFGATDSLSGVNPASVIGHLTNTVGDSVMVPDGFVVSEPGVYTLVAKAADKAGNVVFSEPVFFVVYDPDGGFATGGGWILPDRESTLPDERANFGFAAKYKKDVSTGNLEFQYQDADINLKSISINWLTISGNKAIFQGTGTINGEGFYTFRVKADDNGEPGIGVDVFDIKIWEGVDTEADPVHKAKNTISGGNIRVHKK